jgi:hypothetical protein
MLGFDPYLGCFRCGTSSPKTKLLASICSDGFSVRVLEVVVDVAPVAETAAAKGPVVAPCPAVP